MCPAPRTLTAGCQNASALTNLYWMGFGKGGHGQIFIPCIFLFFQVITPHNGRYQIDSDVLLIPWKLTYRNIGSGFIPRGAFGKVYLAQDMKTKKRMACKLVCAFRRCAGHSCFCLFALTQGSTLRLDLTSWKHLFFWICVLPGTTQPLNLCLGA